MELELICTLMGAQVFLAATQFHQEAGTFKDAILKQENGAVTKAMTRFYNNGGSSQQIKHTPIVLLSPVLLH